MSQPVQDVVIIGTGPAGLTAAIYAARGGFKPIVYAGMQHGGQLTTTTEIDNWPGFREGIMGPALMADMTAQAERFGSEIIYDEITKVDFSGKVHKLWAGDKEIQAKVVIIATGATAKTLGLPREAELMGRGLSTCATCDGFFYKGKKVAIVGGGDTAMEEASYLAKLAKEVVLIHRRDVFKASDIMLKRVKSLPNVTMHIPYDVVDTLSDATGLTGIVLKHTQTGAKSEMKLDGFFMAIGHRPNSGVFKSFVDTDDHGYMTVKDFTKTKVPGIYAAGDIADPVFRQAVTASGMGCQAAMQAIRYLEEQHG